MAEADLTAWAADRPKSTRPRACRPQGAFRTTDPANPDAAPPTRHYIDQRHLEIARGLVAGDPVLAEGPDNRADVLVLELNRTAVAVDLGLKIAIVRGLVIGLASKVRSQHREVVRDDQVVL